MLFLRKEKYEYLDKAKQVAKDEEKWEIEKENLKRQRKIREEYNELTKSTTNSLTMSKKALIFLFISCNFIEIFTAWVTIQSLHLALVMGIMPDFTPLVTLIGTVVGEVIALAAYYAKSTKENTTGGITYEAAAANNFNCYYDENAVG